MKKLSLAILFSVFLFALSYSGESSSSSSLSSNTITGSSSLSSNIVTMPYYTCGIFDSPLISYNTLQINGQYLKIYGSNSISAKIYNDSNHNLQCSAYEQYSGLNNCINNKLPINKYNPNFIESTEIKTIPDDFNFTQNNYENYDFNNQTNFYFKANGNYSNSNRKYMALGSYTFNKDNTTIHFAPGDYYFDGNLIFNKNNLTFDIPSNGSVRIFVKNDLTFGGNNVHININGNANNLFVYVGGNLNIQGSSGGTGTEIKGFFYVKGSVNLNNNSNNFKWYGALTAEGNINLGANNLEFYYVKPDNNLGYEKCPYGNYTGIRGPFDAWDTFRNIKDRNISTKIVNKKFALILASLNEQDDAIEQKNVGDINVSIYDMLSSKRISNIVYFDTDTTPIAYKNFTVEQASKNARVGFLICSDYNATTKNHILFNYSHCSGIVHNCSYADNQNPTFKLCFSSDNFAIRPDKFIITNIPKEKIKAGKEFNLTIKALDYKGNSTKNYNETLHLKDKTSPYLDYFDTNNSKGCITGNLNGKNLQFKNGVANITLNYSEVGDLNITVKEINGSEFAKVDANDTSWNDREITPAEVNLTFIPDHFNISANYYNFNHSNFTYISNDLNMSSILDINITAKNAENETTKNYNSKCYAQNYDLNISYGSIPSKLTKILVKENNDETNITIPNQIYLKFTKDIFTTDNNGSANLNLKINFKRNPANYINEFNFIVKNINVNDSNNIKGSEFLNKNATFRYGRIDVSNIGSYSKELNTTYQYEYWTNDGWIVNKEHNSSIFGDVNESKSYHPFITMDVNHNIKKAKENVTLSTTHAIPYSTKIHLAIPSWLWYNPLAESYKAPSAANQNCLTHPCENITFSKIGKSWGGIGKNNVKFSKTNRTAKINASLKRIKANKSEVRRLNW